MRSSLLLLSRRSFSMRSFLAPLGTSLCGALLALTSMIAIPTNAAAQSATVSVDVEVAGEPIAVTGIALGPGLIMTREVATKRFSENTLTVTFSVPEKSISVLAMAEMPDGTTIFGDTRLVGQAARTSSLASLPECPLTGVIRADGSQRGLMQSLVEIRTARREVLRTNISKLLAGDTLEKAKRLEELFGLGNSESPLSANLPAQVLIDRLSRLNGAISSYRSTRAALRAASAERAEGKAATR